METFECINKECRKIVTVTRNRGRKYCSYNCCLQDRKWETCEKGHILDETSYIYKNGKRRCGTCNKAYVKDYMAKNPVRMKKIREKTYLKMKYSITKETFNNIAKSQKYKCAICGARRGSKKHKNLFVDHNHITGIVRGLLCSKCNLGLGHFADSLKLIKLAGEYLTKHGETIT